MSTEQPKIKLSKYVYYKYLKTKITLKVDT